MQSQGLESIVGGATLRGEQGEGKSWDPQHLTVICIITTIKVSVHGAPSVRHALYHFTPVIEYSDNTVYR